MKDEIDINLSSHIATNMEQRNFYIHIINLFYTLFHPKILKSKIVGFRTNSVPAVVGYDKGLAALCCKDKSLCGNFQTDKQEIE